MIAPYADMGAGYMLDTGKIIARKSGKIAFAGLVALVVLSSGGCPGKDPSTEPQVPQGPLGPGTGPSSYMSAHKDRGEKKAPTVGGGFCGVNCPTNTHP